MSQAQQDPYNWRMPSRKDLMSLDTITQEKDLFRNKTAQAGKRMRSTSQNLETSDIKGSKPKQWVRESSNRPEFQNQNWDIDRSCPRALHFKLNKPEYNLANDDIEKSKPNYIKFQTTRPPSNPLNPSYKLSEVEYRPPTPPKFIRDQMAINDIEGARPKKDRFFETRNIMDVGDIHGTKAKKVYVRETAHDSFNYHDITKNKFVSSRSVNPLTPSYTVKNESGQAVQIGEIPGSSPKKLPVRTTGNFPSFLDVQDIKGTNVGSRTAGNFHSRERQHFRDTNNIAEVSGAQPGTKKRGVSSTRQTNPLDPKYTLPGASELGPLHKNDPYGTSGSSMDSKFVKARKQQEAKQDLQKTKTVKEIVKEQDNFKKDMAKFYGVNPAATKNVDLNNFVGQVGDQGKENKTHTLHYASKVRPATASEHQDESGHQNPQVHFDQEKNASGSLAVIGNNQVPRAMTAQNLQRKNTEQANHLLQRNAPNSQIFKKNAAAFYGASFDNKSVSSQGSLFQRNAANFYGFEHPGPGERPFKIQKPSAEEVKTSKGFSVLNERRLKEHEFNMQRDPKFIKNKDKFYAEGKLQASKSEASHQSQIKSKLSHAQKLDNYIQLK